MRLAILVLLGASCFGQTVSDITFSEVSFGSVSVQFHVSSTATGARLRYGTSDCAGGTGGTVVEKYFALFPLAMTLNASGLTPNTTYYFCPEVKNGGGTWSSGVSASQATTAAPGTLPVPPTPPTTFDTAMPDTSGYTVNAVASNCSDFQDKIDAAVAGWPADGQLVTLPLNVTGCTGNYILRSPPNIKSFDSVSAGQSVTSSTCTFNITAHGLTDGGLAFMSNTAANGLPGRYPRMADGTFSYFSTGAFLEGRPYYVKYIDADNFQLSETSGGAAKICGHITFTADDSTDKITILPQVTYYNGVTLDPAIPIQLYSTGTLPGGLSVDTNYYSVGATGCTSAGSCVSGLSLTQGGSAIDITDAGTGTLYIVGRGGGTSYIAPFVPDDPYIVIEPADMSVVPPEGSRVDATWASGLPNIVQSSAYNGGAGTNKFYCEPLANHWRIVGLNITYPSMPTTGIDNPTQGGIVYCEPASANIIVDRVYADSLGYPQRAAPINLYFQGYGMALLDSSLLHQDIWRVTRTNMLLSKVDGTQVQVSAGSNILGSSFCNMTASGTSTLTVTAGTGTAYVYSDTSCVLTANLPTGGSASWSCSAGITCAVTTSASPGYPVNGSGVVAASQFGTFTISSGTVGTVTPNLGASPPGASSEGPQPIITGLGERIVIKNNHVQGLGVLWHADGCGPQRVPRGYDFAKNWWDVPAYGMLGGPSSNGLTYKHRQGPEIKCGSEAQFIGDRLTGQFNQQTAASVSYAFTPTERATTQDLKVKSLSLLNVTGGFNGPWPSTAGQQLGAPVKRIVFDNNTVNSVNTQRATGAGVVNGWFIEGAGANESTAITRNLTYNSTGSYPYAFWWETNYVSAFKFTGNLFTYASNAIAGSPANPECGSGGSVKDKAFFDCTMPVGNTSAGYIFDDTNVFVPGYSASGDVPPTGETSASTINAGGLPGIGVQVVPSQGTAAANIAYVEFEDPSAYRFKLDAGSPYHNACGGVDCGPDIDEQMDDQGIVRDIVATPGVTSISVSATYPDTKTAYYSVDGGAWTAVSGAAGTRTFNITGLDQNTEYTISILDYFEQTEDAGFSGDQLTTFNVTTNPPPSTSVSISGGVAISGGVVVQ